MGKEIIFVYNAHSGKLHKLWDAAHKIVSPETYACQLCSLTHGALTMHKEWKVFKDKMIHQHELVFVYKNDFLDLYPEKISGITFPVVVQQLAGGDDFKVLLSAAALAELSSTTEFIERLEQLLTEK